MACVNLSSPWINLYHEIQAMFKHDPEIYVIYDDDSTEIKVYVDNAQKATCLSSILVDERCFGNVVVHVTVIPLNNVNTFSPQYLTNEYIFFTVFEGNDAFNYAKTIKGVYQNDLVYVVFKNEVVQYFNDDIGDIHGYHSTLYQDIANDIFTNKNGVVFFCTDIPENKK